MADDARQALATMAAARGVSLAELSRMIGRNVAYLQQFVTRGSPRRLSEDDRALLAAFLGCDEQTLGGGVVPTPAIAVPYLDIAASAGAGRVTGDEVVRRHDMIAAEMLRDAGIRAGAASLIDATGDSMAPTILDGDRLLIDGDDRRIVDRAIYIIRRDEALSVKRLARRGKAIVIGSDNDAYDPVTVTGDALEVVGRVKLLLRRT